MLIRDPAVMLKVKGIISDKREHTRTTFEWWVNCWKISLLKTNSANDEQMQNLENLIPCTKQEKTNYVKVLLNENL